MISKQKKAYIYAGIAVFMWSTAGSAFKVTLRHISPLQMLWFAAFTSVVVLFTILVIQKKTGLLRQSSLKDVGRSAVLGFMNPFIFYIVLFKAYDLLLTQEAMVLNFTWPITLTILSIPVLKQKISLRSIIAILISFAGIVVIGTNGHVADLKFSNTTGVMLALGSTFIWSVFWLMNMKDQRDEVVKLFLNFATGFVYITILVFVTGQAVMPGPEAIAGSVYIGIFEMGVAYVLWLMALQLSSTTARVSNLIFLAPFLSLVIISVVVGEQILASTLYGLVLIVGGIALQKK
jgi:drug/metabolite transporter (DMT)-like permease